MGPGDATAPDAEGFGFLSDHRACLAVLWMIVDQAGGTLTLPIARAQELMTKCDEDLGALCYTTDAAGNIVFHTRRLFDG